MLEKYVEFICEWEEVPYKSNLSLDVWKIEKQQQINKKIQTINYVKRQPEQITMFDYEIENKSAM